MADLTPITREEKIIAGEDVKPVTRLEKFLKKFGGGSSSGGGADWNASEGEAGYVKNRTHYEETTVVNEPLNITWDGNTEGLVSVADAFFKVSDVVLTDEQIKTSTITLQNETEPLVSNWDEDLEYGYIVLTEDYLFVWPIIVIRKPGVVFDGLEFPEIGVYSNQCPDPYTITTTEPIEHTKTVVKKLDKKFLPDDVGGGGAEIIETTPHSSYQNMVNIPVTGAEIHAKVNAGKDVVIKFNTVSGGLTYTNFARLAYHREDGWLSFVAFNLGNNMCYKLDVSDDPNEKTASYSVRTITMQ